MLELSELFVVKLLCCGACYWYIRLHVGSASSSTVSAVCFMVVSSALWVLERIHNGGGGCTLFRLTSSDLN